MEECHCLGPCPYMETDTPCEECNYYYEGWDWYEDNLQESEDKE